MVIDIHFVMINIYYRWLNGKMRTKMHSQLPQLKSKFLYFSYTKKGDLNQAIAEYKRLTSPDPTKANPLIHPRYYYSLGKLYEEKGVKDKARHYYRRFLDL